MTLTQMKDAVLDDWCDTCSVDPGFLRSLLRNLLDHYTDDEIARAYRDAFDRDDDDDDDDPTYGGWVPYPVTLKDGLFREDLSLIQKLVGDSLYEWKPIGENVWIQRLQD